MTDIRRWAAWLLVPALMVSAVATAQEYRKKAPEGAEVYIITPQDGATLKSPAKV